MNDLVKFVTGNLFKNKIITLYKRSHLYPYNNLSWKEKERLYEEQNEEGFLIRTIFRPSYRGYYSNIFFHKFKENYHNWSLLLEKEDNKLSKEDIAKEILNNVPKEFLNDIIVTHGGALCLLGIIEKTYDVDLSVSEKFFNYLIDEGYRVQNMPPCGERGEHKYIELSFNIDCYIHLDNDHAVTSHSFFNSSTAEQVLKDKLKLNRDKDKKIIEKLTIS